VAGADVALAVGPVVLVVVPAGKLVVELTSVALPELVAAVAPEELVLALAVVPEELVLALAVGAVVALAVGAVVALVVGAVVALVVPVDVGAIVAPPAQGSELYVIAPQL